MAAAAFVAPTHRLGESGLYKYWVYCGGDIQLLCRPSK